jgi:predicted MFS family arabinose efflux permease
MAAKKKIFKSLFGVMLIYAMFYTATLPLVNSLMFSHLTDGAVQSPKIFIWAPVAWVLIGWALTVWRRVKGTGEGSDCLVFAAILSVVMGVFCLFLPHTPPAGEAGRLLAFVEAFSMLSNINFLIFILVSFIVSAQLQFYFLGTAQYLQDIGVQSKNVPAVMTIAQIAQSIATVVLLGRLLSNFGFRGTLAVGALCWLVMYLGYTAGRPKELVIGSQALHGLAYVFFIIGGQIYVDSVAPANIKSSAQALLFVVTIGFGLFLGTQFTGTVMDKFSKEGRFQWQSIFLVPCALLLICTIVFAVFFKG